MGDPMNAVSLGLSLFALLISGWFAMRSERLARNAQETAMILEAITSQARDDRYLASEAFILDELGRFDPAGGISGLPEPARTHVTRIGTLYGSIGGLLALDGVKKDIVLPMLSYRIIAMWERSAPFIRAERANTGNDRYRFFEHLYCLAVETPADTYHQRLGLRRAPAPPVTQAGPVTSAPPVTPRGQAPSAPERPVAEG